MPNQSQKTIITTQIWSWINVIQKKKFPHSEKWQRLKKNVEKKIKRAEKKREKEIKRAKKKRKIRSDQGALAVPFVLDYSPSGRIIRG